MKKRLIPLVIALGFLNIFQGFQLFRVLENYKGFASWRIVFSITGFTIILLFSIYILFRLFKSSKKDK